MAFTYQFKENFTGCDIDILKNQSENYVFNGKVKDYLDSLTRSFNVFVQYWAPNKTNRGYASHQLPFPNEETAYENTSNKGVVRIYDGNFSFNLDNPNSYYTQLGKKLNPPLVKFRFTDRDASPVTGLYTVILGDPAQSLDRRPVETFNVTNEPKCRTQAQILIDSQYAR